MSDDGYSRGFIPNPLAEDLVRSEAERGTVCPILLAGALAPEIMRYILAARRGDAARSDLKPLFDRLLDDVFPAGEREDLHGSLVPVAVEALAVAARYKALVATVDPSMRDGLFRDVAHAFFLGAFVGFAGEAESARFVGPADWTPLEARLKLQNDYEADLRHVAVMFAGTRFGPTADDLRSHNQKITERKMARLAFVDRLDREGQYQGSASPTAIAPQDSAMAVGLGDMKTFSFEGVDVRLVRRGGDIHFVGVDVLAAMGRVPKGEILDRPNQVRQKFGNLDPDETSVIDLPTAKGSRGCFCVTMSGFLTFVLRSHSAMVPGTLSHRIRRWATGVVLPSVIMDGFYLDPSARFSFLGDGAGASHPAVVSGRPRRYANSDQIAKVVRLCARKVETLERLIINLRQCNEDLSTTLYETDLAMNGAKREAALADSKRLVAEHAVAAMEQVLRGFKRKVSDAEAALREVVRLREENNRFAEQIEALSSRVKVLSEEFARDLEKDRLKAPGFECLRPGWRA